MIRASAASDARVERRSDSSWSSRLWANTRKRGPGRLGSVDQARVREFVEDDDIAFPQQGREHAGAGGKPAAKSERGFGALERRQGFLKDDMRELGAANQPRGSGAKAELDAADRKASASAGCVARPR